jgi:hypothetical protein
MKGSDPSRLVDASHLQRFDAYRPGDALHRKGSDPSSVGEAWARQQSGADGGGAVAVGRFVIPHAFQVFSTG